MSAKQPLILMGMLGGAALAVWGVFMVFTGLAASEFIPGEDVYTRDIYVVIDQTYSMQEDQRMEAKDILLDEVLSVLGPGDRISCYQIASDFQESRDRVFVSSRRVPKIPVNVPGISKSELPEPIQQNLTESWQRLARERDRWTSRLNSLQPQRGGYSDYLGTVNEIGRRITNDSDPNLAAEKWLLLIGYLKHEPILAKAPTPKREEKRRYANVNVQLVYPGGVHSTQEQQRIETFWREYFAARGNKRIEISSYDGFIGRFPEVQVVR